MKERRTTHLPAKNSNQSDDSIGLRGIHGSTIQSRISGAEEATGSHAWDEASQ